MPSKINITFRISLPNLPKIMIKVKKPINKNESAKILKAGCLFKEIAEMQKA